MAKYKVGDKFYDETIKEEVEILMVAPTKNSNGDQIYFTKDVEIESGFIYYSAICEEYFDEEDVKKIN